MGFFDFARDMRTAPKGTSTKRQAERDSASVLSDFDIFGAPWETQAVPEFTPDEGGSNIFRDVIQPEPEPAPQPSFDPRPEADFSPFGDSGEPFSLFDTPDFGPPPEPEPGPMDFEPSPSPFGIFNDTWMEPLPPDQQRPMGGPLTEPFETRPESDPFGANARALTSEGIVFDRPDPKAFNLGGGFGSFRIPEEPPMRFEDPAEQITPFTSFQPGAGQFFDQILPAADGGHRYQQEFQPGYQPGEENIPGSGYTEPPEPTNIFGQGGMIDQTLQFGQGLADWKQQMNWEDEQRELSGVARSDFDDQVNEHYASLESEDDYWREGRAWNPNAGGFGGDLSDEQRSRLPATSREYAAMPGERKNAIFNEWVVDSPYQAKGYGGELLPGVLKPNDEPGGPCRCSTSQRTSSPLRSTSSGEQPQLQ
jgi:hypothetical protein